MVVAWVALLFSAVAQAEVPETLEVRDLIHRPDRWPAEVSIAADLDFGEFVVEAGTPGKVMGFNGRDVELALPDEVYISVGLEDCDLVAAANAAWATLSDEQRALDEKALLADASLWPETVVSTMAFEFDNGVSLPSGHAYTLVWVGRDGIRAYDAAKDLRIVVPIGQSDLFARARERAGIPKAERPAKLIEQLTGKVVDAEGNAVDAAAYRDGTVFALYFAASWCGYCKEFNPEFVEAIERARVRYPDLVVVLISTDEEVEKMYGYMKSGQVPWPAVSHATMKASAWLSGLYGGGVPQVVIVDRDGKVEATSTEMRRAEVLRALPGVLRAKAG